MGYVKGTLAIVVLLVMVIFAIENLEIIQISFLTMSMSVPKFLVIIATYVLGMITGAWLYDFVKYLLRKKPEEASK